MSIDRIRYIVKEEFIKELLERRKQKWSTSVKEYKYRPKT